MTARLTTAARLRLRVPAWQHAYEATLQATDTNSLFKLLEIAEPAVLIRRDHLKGKSRNKAERRAIEAAFLMLSSIKKDRLKF